MVIVFDRRREKRGEVRERGRPEIEERRKKMKENKGCRSIRKERNMGLIY